MLGPSVLILKGHWAVSAALDQASAHVTSCLEQSSHALYVRANPFCGGPFLLHIALSLAIYL